MPVDSAALASNLSSMFIVVLNEPTLNTQLWVIYPEGLIVAYDDISVLVKDLREHLGLTQEQLAHELGVTFSMVNQWENGRRRPHPFLRKRLLEMKASLDQASTSRFTKAKARALQNRLQDANVAKYSELASLPETKKFRRLAKLMVSAHRLGWTEGQSAEEDEIRQRWMRLRRVLHA